MPLDPLTVDHELLDYRAAAFDLLSQIHDGTSADLALTRAAIAGVWVLLDIGTQLVDLTRAVSELAPSADLLEEATGTATIPTTPESEAVSEVLTATVRRLFELDRAARRVIEEWATYDPATDPHSRPFAGAMLDLAESLKERR